MGALQLYARPALLGEVLKKLDVRGLFVPDEKRILIDESQPPPKHRWLEAHEIGHSMLPWHVDAMFGDSAHTLTPACNEAVESEANFAAGQMLFLREQFATEVLGHDPKIAAARALKNRYGNTLTTTFWRCVQAWGTQRPIIGILSAHPHPSRRNSDFDPGNPCRHFIQSHAFAHQFSSLTEVEVFAHVEAYCTAQRGGPIGASEIALRDDNGQHHLFTFETFFNRYDAMTLGVHQGLLPKQIALA